MSIDWLNSRLVNTQMFSFQFPSNSTVKRVIIDADVHVQIDNYKRKTTASSPMQLLRLIQATPEVSHLEIVVKEETSQPHILMQHLSRLDTVKKLELTNCKIFKTPATITQTWPGLLTNLHLDKCSLKGWSSNSIGGNLQRLEMLVLIQCSGIEADLTLDCPLLSYLMCSDLDQLQSINLEACSLLHTLILEGSTLQEVQIPSTVRNFVGDGSSYLRKVDATKCIGLETFHINDCVAITTIDLQDNEELHDLSMEGCLSLTEVNLSGCSMLIYFSNNIALIGLNAANCPLLESVVGSHFLANKVDADNNRD